MRAPVEHGDGIDGKEGDEPEEEHDDRAVSRIVFEVFPDPLHFVELTGDELAAEEEPHEVGRRQLHDDTGDVDEQADDRCERHTDTHVDEGRRDDEDDRLDGEQRHDDQEPFPGRPGPADHLLDVEVTERVEVQDDEREQETDDQEPQDVLPVFFPVLFQVEIFHRHWWMVTEGMHNPPASFFQ